MSDVTITITGNAEIPSLPIAVQNAFNLIGSNIAIGAQLDVLGKYTGVSRSGAGFAGPIILDDADFLQLIRLAIVTNSEGSDLGTIENLLNQFFPNGEILVFDYQNMRMSYLINSSIGSQELVQLFVTEGLLPKPMGVQLAAPIYSNNLKFFGMVSASTVAAYAAQNSVSVNTAANAVMAADNITPLNTAAAPSTTVWLSAELGVSV